MPPCFVDAAHCGSHVLGVDENGRDILARLIVATPAAIGIALSNTAVAAALAALLALLSRFKAADILATALTRGLSSFPPWPFVAVITAVKLVSAGPHTTIVPVECTVFGMLLFAPIAVALRSEAFPLGVLGACAVVARNTVLGVAVIDFLGFGIQPPTASLGNMLVNGESNAEIAWWSVVFPLAALTLLIGLLQVIAGIRYLGRPSTTRCAPRRATLLRMTQERKTKVPPSAADRLK